MPDVLIIIDTLGIFIEGQALSARMKGMNKKDGESRSPVDPSWRPDFGSLVDFLADQRGIISSIFLGSAPCNADNIWMSAEKQDFEIIIRDKTSSGPERIPDTEIIAGAAEIICDEKAPGVLIMTTRDREFLPIVRLAHRREWRVEFCGFSNTLERSSAISMEADCIRVIDPVLSRIGKSQFDWPLPNQP